MKVHSTAVGKGWWPNVPIRERKEAIETIVSELESAEIPDGSNFWEAIISIVHESVKREVGGWKSEPDNVMQFDFNEILRQLLRRARDVAQAAIAGAAVLIPQRSWWRGRAGCKNRAKEISLIFDGIHSRDVQ